MESTPDTNAISLGQRLLAARVSANHSQETLAEAIGVSARSIQRWERDRAVPQGQSRELLCQALQVSRETLFGNISSVPFAEKPWCVPYQRNPFFTGRETLLRHLHTTLSQQKLATLARSSALSGPGGIGKTQVALEYAYRYAQDYTAMLWVGAEEPETIISSFVSIATFLQLPASQQPDQNKVVSAVRNWLDTHCDWLLVLDNVEDLEMLKGFLPTANRGTLLLTTQRNTVGTLALSMEVPQMPLEESVLFLLQRARRIDPHLPFDSQLDHIPDIVTARMIAEAMGGLPLALDQAGGYIEETQCSLEDFLHLLQDSPLQMLRERNVYSNHPFSVERTIQLSLEKVRPGSPGAIDILTICSFLAPDAIPERLLTEGAFCLGPTSQAVLTTPRKFNAALKELLTYSLIRRHSRTKTLTIHRLVQTTLKAGLDERTRQRWAMHVFEMVNQAFPDDQSSMQIWPWCEQLLPHALFLIRQSGEGTCTLTTHSALLTKTANYLAQRERYAEAETLYQQALLLLAQTSEAVDADVAALLNDIADIKRKQGKYAEAEMYYQRAAGIYQQMPSVDSVQAIRPLCGLVCLLSEFGRYEEAEQLFQRILHEREQALGSEHIDLAMLLEMFAALCFKAGKYAKSRELAQRALRLQEQVVGPDHPCLSTLLCTLALSSCAQCRLNSQETEALLLRAITIQEKAQGIETANIAMLLNNLAALYIETGRYSEAEPLLLRALHIQEHTCGTENLRFAFYMDTLGMLHLKMGRYAEAETSYQRALQLFEQCSDMSHPAIRYPLTGLANLYVRQGKHKEADVLLQRIASLSEQEPAATHLLILNSQKVSGWGGRLARVANIEEHPKKLSSHVFERIFLVCLIIPHLGPKRRMPIRSHNRSLAACSASSNPLIPLPLR
ncbi:FxSxx-COOH system tetratricopeptide repeat protein [Dictyobacter aurantiacus]|uniref:Tetratricopeptide repeat protein n=1 Tax=Dictyobacter aurantiacus TaxID=1936993 RepID=A0A401ZJR0_9CHLR|nr:FxSxx-COOH system tetratricopeptide repeat protein [Dictyobacter aurantiacus]GCE07072.1 tetratricopeptide repeat protein [Dictyobacter aurantiacus]